METKEKRTREAEWCCGRGGAREGAQHGEEEGKRLDGRRRAQQIAKYRKFNSKGKIDR